MQDFNTSLLLKVLQSLLDMLERTPDSDEQLKEVLKERVQKIESLEPLPSGQRSP